jgi:hypothetical protein
MQSCKCKTKIKNYKQEDQEGNEDNDKKLKTEMKGKLLSYNYL